MTVATLSTQQREILDALARHWDLLRWRCRAGAHRWHMGEDEVDGRAVRGLRTRGLVEPGGTYAGGQLVLTERGRAEVRAMVERQHGRRHAMPSLAPARTAGARPWCHCSTRSTVGVRQPLLSGDVGGGAMNVWSDRPDRLSIGTRLDDEDYRECPCGTGEQYFGEGSGARTRHANWHLEWDRGAPISDGVSWFDSLAIVTGESRLAERKIGYRLGRLFQREQGYDSPMAPDPRSWPGNLSEVLVAVHHSHAIGGLFTYPTMRYGLWDGSPGRIQITVETMAPVPQVSGIWVCRGYRRRGIGAALVKALGEYADLPLQEVVWGLPFTDGGKALAARVSGFPMRVA